MTSEEKQEIISAVLAALHTNSKTIAQLTPVTALNDNDSFEVSGGRRISYARLMEIVSAAVDLSEVEAGIAANVLNSLSVTEVQGGIKLTIKQEARNAVTVMIPYVDDETGGFISAEQYAALPKWDDAYNAFVKKTPELNNTYPEDANIVILERIDGEFQGTQLTGTAWYNGTQLKVVNFEGEVEQMAVDNNRLYYDKTTKLLYRCNENYRLVPVAGDISAIEDIATEEDINEVISGIGDGTDVFNAIKSNINIVQSNVAALLEGLANIAFVGNKPTIQSLDWSGSNIPDDGGDSPDMFSVSIVNNVSNSVVKRNGTAVNSPISVTAGSELVLTIETDSGYEFSSLSSSAGTLSGSGNTRTLSLSNIQSDITVTITGATSITEPDEPDDYVQNGLVFQLDANDLSEGDDSWRDKIGGYVFDFDGSPELVDDGDGNIIGVKFESGQSASCDADGNLNFYHSTSTIEVCFTPLEGFISQQRTLFRPTEADMMAAVFMPASTTGSPNKMAFNAHSPEPTGTGSDYDAYETQDITAGVGECIGMNHSRMVRNGNTYTEKVKTNLMRNTEYTLVGGGGDVSNSERNLYANAIIHSIRIYNRLLTAADMKANQRVDNVKYNLGLTIQ